MTACQKKDAPGKTIAPPLTIKQTGSQKVTPYHVLLEHCEKPKPNQEKRTIKFAVSNDNIEMSRQLNCANKRCSCAAANLSCTEMCQCSSGWEND